MAVMNEYAPGAPCWYELATTDREAANAFYSDIFGWTVDNVPIGTSETYTLFKLGGLDVAASCDVQQPGQHPHWLTYFNAPEIDATAAKATELGASVLMPPFDVATHGRMAVIRDPEGVYFALWKAASHIGAQRNGDMNTIGWSELASRDNEAAAKFYGELLGLVSKPHSIGMEYIEFGAGVHTLGGFLKMSADWGDVPPHWSFYVQVPDCDAVVARVKELGGKVLHGPFDAPGVGRIAMLMDPQGAKFNIITLSAAA